LDADFFESAWFFENFTVLDLVAVFLGGFVYAFVYSVFLFSVFVACCVVVFLGVLLFVGLANFLFS